MPGHGPQGAGCHYGVTGVRRRDAVGPGVRHRGGISLDLRGGGGGGGGELRRSDTPACPVRAATPDGWFNAPTGAQSDGAALIHAGHRSRHHPPHNAGTGLSFEWNMGGDVREQGAKVRVWAFVLCPGSIEGGGGGGQAATHLRAPQFRALANLPTSRQTPFPCRPAALGVFSTESHVMVNGTYLSNTIIGSETVGFSGGHFRFVI